MTEEKIEIVRGSGNVYADMSDPDADAKQMKAFLAAEIIAVRHRRRLTVRATEELNGVPPLDVSSIRIAHLGKFTIDRLVRILNRLDRKVTVAVEKAGHGTVAARCLARGTMSTPASMSASGSSGSAVRDRQAVARRTGPRSSTATRITRLPWPVSSPSLRSAAPRDLAERLPNPIPPYRFG